MTTVHLVCLIPGCSEEADPTASSGDQYRHIKNHYETKHFHGRKNTGMGINTDNEVSRSGQEKIRAEIDRLVRMAIEWPGVESGPFDSMPVKILEDEVKKKQETAIGRGLARALCWITGVGDENDIIRDSAARMREQIAAEALQSELGATPVAEESPAPVTPTPGATWTSPAPTVAPAPPAAPTPAPAPAIPMPAPAPASGVATMDPPAPATTATLTPEQVQSIQIGLAGGFDAGAFAERFGVSVDVIEACR